MYYVIPNPVSLVSGTFPVLDTRGNRVPLGKASAAAKGAELSATQPHGPVRQPILTWADAAVGDTSIVHVVYVFEVGKFN